MSGFSQEAGEITLKTSGKWGSRFVFLPEDGNVQLTGSQEHCGHYRAEPASETKAKWHVCGGRGKPVFCY